MAIIHAEGVGVRHAVARTLATANLEPAEATFRVLTARVDLDGRKRVVRGSASVAIEEASPIGDRTPARLDGLVNPDGLHPLMSRVPSSVLSDGRTCGPFFMDILPVTWDRWRRVMGDEIPGDVDIHCPRTGVTLEQARGLAARVGKRLPTIDQLQAAWGPARFPWGDGADAALGRVGAPRWGQLPELGLHPPSRHGIWDLGCWLWQWTADGRLAGGHDDAVGVDAPGFTVVDPATPGLAELLPIGIRLVQHA